MLPPDELRRQPRLSFCVLSMFPSCPHWSFKGARAGESRMENAIVAYSLCTIHFYLIGAWIAPIRGAVCRQLCERSRWYKFVFWINCVNVGQLANRQLATAWYRETREKLGKKPPLPTINPPLTPNTLITNKSNTNKDIDNSKLQA